MCSVESCERKTYARGWCKSHYERWRKHGDPLAGRKLRAYYMDPEGAFLARTEPIVGEPAHIIWTGATNSKGYGSLTVNGRKMLAHRYAWQRVNGPIPDGMVVDHTCHTPACVLPDHLRLASPAQNAQNLSGPRTGRTLPRGVYRAGRKYVAKVGNAGRLLHFGTYDTIEEAAAVASAKRKELFGEFAGAA